MSSLEIVRKIDRLRELGRSDNFTLGIIYASSEVEFITEATPIHDAVSLILQRTNGYVYRGESFALGYLISKLEALLALPSPSISDIPAPPIPPNLDNKGQEIPRTQVNTLPSDSSDNIPLNNDSDLDASDATPVTTQSPSSLSDSNIKIITTAELVRTAITSYFTQHPEKATSDAIYTFVQPKIYEDHQRRLTKADFKTIVHHMVVSKRLLHEDVPRDHPDRTHAKYWYMLAEAPVKSDTK